MFKNIKKEIVGLVLMLGALTSVNAVVLNAPGSYVGVTDINCTAVRVNFADNSNNENGFIVSGNFPSSPIMLPANDETVNSEVYVDITGLKNECNITLNIVAYNNGNNSTTINRSFNMKTTFGLTDCCEGDTAQPGPYIGVTDINCTAVRINFADNAINEDGFIVTGNFPTSPMTLPAHTDENTSQVYANITGLESNQTYSITKVVAYNNNGNSIPSDTRLFNIESTFGVTSPCDGGCDQTVAPVAPGSYIGVTDINKTAVKINFLDNSDNENRFILSISDTNGDRNITIPENNVTAPSQTYVTVDGLTCNRTYTVKALAYNCAGNSATSDERTFSIQNTFSVTCP